MELLRSTRITVALRNTVDSFRAKIDDIVNKYRAQFAKASEEAVRQHNQLKTQLQAQAAAFEALQAEVSLLFFWEENLDHVSFRAADSCVCSQSCSLRPARRVHKTLKG